MIITSAPAKIILFGEHAVNRQQLAIAAALGVRTQCQLQPCADGRVNLRSGTQVCYTDRTALLDFAQTINIFRKAGDYTAIRFQARDFFAPVKYVFGTFLARYGGDGAAVEWQTEIPPGSGLGSGAAASSALALALSLANAIRCSRAELAELAWQGDIIAHGGIASGLDTGASTFGGITRYTVANGPEIVPIPHAPTLVIGDTGVRANTSQVNARVNDWLAGDSQRLAVFARMGNVAERALEHLGQANWQAVGALMNENQMYLRQIGVSSPELEKLIDGALAAGALGAKLSGAGGGGVMVALTTPTQQTVVAEAIQGAGGRALIVEAGVEGVQIVQNDY
ncbi:MAG TPA: mevalonate kinase [Anaerolineae bacterium]|nr:mevalonate kinase [Anaerolineae bacterium]